MAVAIRLLHTLFSSFLCVWFFLLQAQMVVSASPLTTSHPHVFFPRAKPIVNNSTGTLQIFDSATSQAIPQSIASDGAGANFSGPAIIWIVFCAVVGLPLALVGIRGWRLTTGASIGLTGAVCSWISLINSISATGLPDILIIAVVLSFFVLGFILGVFNIGRIAGIALLGILSGLAIGARIVLLKQQLLVAPDDLFFLNWVIVAAFGLLNELALIWRQRLGITVSAASVGSFLSLLALDLAINKQAGMSRGLRFLFDRNSSHLADILQKGYEPPLSTQIILAISLTLIPILAYAQHRLFPHPFSRRPASRADLNSLNLDLEDRRNTIFNPGFEKPDPTTELRSGWDGTFKAVSPSRFSL